MELVINKGGNVKVEAGDLELDNPVQRFDVIGENGESPVTGFHTRSLGNFGIDAVTLGQTDDDNIFYYLDSSAGEYKIYYNQLQPGRSYRIKMQLLIRNTQTVGTSTQVSFQAGMSGGGVLQTEGWTNGGAYHYFNDDSGNVVPVRVESTIICGSTGPNGLYYASGSMRYEYGSYNTSGNNTDVVYSPIWQDRGFNSVPIDSLSENWLWFSPYQISITGTIRCMYCTVEELGACL
jgi:hypothetical protein